jgi:hypothetical protein
MLRAGRGHWLSSNEGRVIHVGNNVGGIVTKVDRVWFEE